MFVHGQKAPGTMNNPFEAEQEGRLLREIGGISDRVRELRRQGAASHGVQIKALEGESRAKWEELRMQRAGPMNDGPPIPRSRMPHR
jgi:hypothetical protein